MTLLEKNLSKFEEYTNLQKKIDDCTGVIKALNREDDIELIIKYILSETTPVTMGEGLAAETTRSLSKPLIKLVTNLTLRGDVLKCFNLAVIIVIKSSVSQLSLVHAVFYLHVL